MKPNRLSFALAALLSVSTLSADTITQWLDAAHKAPNQQLSNLTLDSAHIQSDAAIAVLYPKLTLMGSFEHFNAPTSLRPVTPTEMQQGGAYPFSQTITSAGGTLSMPLFVKTLLTNTEKAKENITSAQLKHQITTAERDAVLIASNAKLTYLENLDLALQAKEHSLTETRKTIEIKTKNGRAAEIELIKIDEQLNQTILKRQEVETMRLDLQKSLSTLTALRIERSVPMSLIHEPSGSEYLSTKEKSQNIKITDLATRAAQESLYPALTTNASYFYRQGDAYNNGESVSRNYGSVALNLTMPLFDKERLSAIELSRLENLKAKTALNQTMLEMNNSASALEEQYKILQQSRILSEKSVVNYEELLKTARVAYATQRLTQEEYLRYEESLVNAKASLHALDATLWQNIAQRAAMIGKDFKEIVQ